MITLAVPGRGEYQLEHLVCDVNGTLALDGELVAGVADELARLREVLTLHLVTADTHGRQLVIDQQLGLQAVRLQPGNEADQKAAYVRQLGAERTAAMGQGANDAGMLAAAALGVCVLSAEGVARETLDAANVVFPGVIAALQWFQFPRRMVATLRK